MTAGKNIPHTLSGFACLRRFLCGYTAQCVRSSYAAPCDSQGLGTIQDNDAAPLVTINDISQIEGGNRQNTSTAFTVSLSAAGERFVFVSYSTANDTAAVADSDYFAANSSVSIAPGQTAATITITVRGDKRKEADETFFVNLTGATNGTISDTQGVGTIENDDGARERQRRRAGEQLRCCRIPAG
ncbi:MAG: hypothetical protein L0211_24115 [Planctomycetaceae bacterium]|nr:hypothetical protein [Planctomycetaceae bacterium]